MNNLASQTIRINEAEMLHLICLYLNLKYIHRNIIKLCKIDSIEPERLIHLMEDWNNVVSQLQDTIYFIHCIPVGTMFKRLARNIRDISKLEEQQIIVRIDGDNIKVNPIVLDEIGFLLYNWIRNLLYHGFKSAEMRCQMGKSQQATLRLHADIQEKDVVIEVSGDGMGINLQHIKTAAIELGLYELQQVTDISEPVIINNLMLGEYTRQAFRALGIIVEIHMQLHQGTTLKLKISDKMTNKAANIYRSNPIFA